MLQSDLEKTLRGFVQNTEFETWLTNVTTLQEAKASHEDPAYYIEELQNRFEVVSGVYTKLRDQKKPKPPKDTKAKAHGNSKKNGTSGNSTADAAENSTASESQAEGDTTGEQGGSTREGQGAAGEAAESEAQVDEPHDEL